MLTAYRIRNRNEGRGILAIYALEHGMENKN